MSLSRSLTEFTEEEVLNIFLLREWQYRKVVLEIWGILNVSMQSLSSCYQIFVKDYNFEQELRCEWPCITVVHANR